MRVGGVPVPDDRTAYGFDSASERDIVLATLREMYGEASVQAEGWYGRMDPSNPIAS